IAARAGGAARVRFVRADAAGGLGGEFDVVTAFDVLHDAVDPGALVAAIRSALRPGGTFLCQEPSAGETTGANLTPGGALYYGVSVLYCLSTSLAAGGAGPGSLGLPESRLTELCTGAGFATVRRLA